MGIEAQKRDWDALGRMDPLFAILLYPDRRYGAWDPEEFFATGQREVAGLMRDLEEVAAGLRRRRALDFGCGVGRLTRALADRFERCVGVDISSTMIEAAREMNGDRPDCDFLVNPAEDLSVFEDRSFDFVYSSIVLQHLPDTRRILAYVREFVRVLDDGGVAAFQIPVRVPWRRRLQPRRRLYGLLRRLGLPEDFLYGRLGLYPIRLIHAPEEAVRSAIREAGGELLSARECAHAGPDIPSRMYFAARARSVG